MDPKQKYNRPEVIPFEPPEYIECPHCDCETDSLKEYLVLETFYFVLIFWRLERTLLTACPKCMRKYLFNRLFANLVTSNLLWPIVNLPLYLITTYRTFMLGHSSSIIEEYRQAYELAIRRVGWEMEDRESEK
jgi:hypothetical protein